MNSKTLEIMRKANPGFFARLEADKLTRQLDFTRNDSSGAFAVRQPPGGGLDYFGDRTGTSSDAFSGSQVYSEDAAGTSCETQSTPSDRFSDREVYSSRVQDTSYQVSYMSNKEREMYPHDMHVETCMSAGFASTSGDDHVASSDVIPDVDDMWSEEIPSEEGTSPHEMTPAIINSSTISPATHKVYSNYEEMPEHLREQVLEEWRLFVWVGKQRPGFPETHATIIVYQGGRPIHRYAVDMRTNVTRWMVDTNRQQANSGESGKAWRRKLADWGRSSAKHGTRAVGTLYKHTQKTGQKVGWYRAVGMDFTALHDCEYGKQQGVVQLWWGNFMYTVRCELPSYPRASSREDRVLWLRATWTRHINVPRVI